MPVGDILSGLARGLTADVVGAPVDFATQVANLGLAGGGYAAHKLGLISQPPDLIEKPIGGSDWFAGKSSPLTDNGSAGYFTGRSTGNILPLLVGMAKAASLQPHGQVNIFAGPNSRTADLAAYRTAQALDAQGIPEADILHQTGWFKGVDNNWRYEIPDNNMTFRSDPGLSSAFTKEELKLPLNEMREAANKRRDMPLFGAISHPELQAAYPQLANIRTDIRQNPDWLLTNLSGSFSPGRIEASAKSSFDLQDTIVHELQHAVQNIEGNASGGNPTYVRQAIYKTAENHPAYKALQLKKMADYLKVAPSSMDSFWKKDVSPGIIDLADGKTQQDLRDMLDRFHSIRGQTDFNLYRSLAGETEARNAATRRTYRPEARNFYYPWETQDVPNGQQIVLQQTGLANPSK